MSRLRLVPNDQIPPLYRRIGFDVDLEAVAFRRLTDLDLEGARAAFGRLVDQLDLGAPGSRNREVTALLHEILQRVNRSVHRGARRDPRLEVQRAELLEQFGAYDDPEDARRAFMRTLGRLLSPLRPAARTFHPLVERARAFIAENYHRRISLSSVASHLHVSANYLSRIFKKETGCTLTSQIHKVRLEHAMHLLAGGDRSISEIAYLVGYQNYRDFYRNFVKHQKASPRQIQRRLACDRDGSGPASADGGSR